MKAAQHLFSCTGKSFNLKMSGPAHILVTVLSCAVTSHKTLPIIPISLHMGAPHRVSLRHLNLQQQIIQ